MNLISHRLCSTTSLLIALAALPACTQAVSPGTSTALTTVGQASTWSNRTTGTAASRLDWVDIASDASGAHLVAVTTNNGVSPDGNIWTSSNGGATWTNRTARTAAAGQEWQSVASDTTGTNLVAVALVGASGLTPTEDVWTSRDAGSTWTKRTSIASKGYMFAPLVSDSSA